MPKSGLASYLDIIQEFYANGAREFFIIGLDNVNRQSQTFIPGGIEPMKLVAILDRAMTRIEESVKPPTDPDDADSTFDEATDESSGHA